ncbi:MAG: hypothetical protein SOR75_00715 [Synergistes jonesii]|uniref:hypothetical protein n=1 Tax=Synergistes jonesii TaxID=2754 RepID=UPI002A75B83F|nr:hypothetical protein [Synergistes jonesii]MDY2983836.1 hypothetical protein [Synergistes jonesii]
MAARPRGGQGAPSAEDVAKLFDDLKAGAMAALGSLKPDFGAEAGSDDKKGEV